MVAECGDPNALKRGLDRRAVCEQSRKAACGYRQAAVACKILRYIADAQSGLAHDLALRRHQLQRFQKGGLPRPVGSDQDDDLTSRNMEIHAVEDRGAATAQSEAQSWRGA